MTAVSPVFKCVKAGTQGQGWIAGKSFFTFYVHKTTMDYLHLIGIYDPMSDI